jgi:hypothetical protein
LVAAVEAVAVALTERVIGSLASLNDQESKSESGLCVAAENIAAAAVYINRDGQAHTCTLPLGRWDATKQTTKR